MGQVRRTPECFESALQFSRWRRASYRSGEGRALTRSGYCLDCTPEFQARMKGEGRCAYPHTTFVRDNNGEVQGQRRRKPCGSHS